MGLAEKKQAAHDLVDTFYDAGKELFILPVPPDMPDEDKPALAIRLKAEIDRTVAS